MTPRQPWPFPTKENHPDPAPGAALPTPITTDEPRPSTQVQVQHVSEDTLDDAVSDTFPASDPVAVGATKVVHDKDKPAATQATPHKR